ncbi:MAG: 30S ribosome-binding factor RbfA [Vicinamibacterales bacterium]
MPLSHRIERISEQIREELSQMLATEVSDPGIGLVTLTRVKVTGDLSLARAYWTIMGDQVEQKKTAQALARATPFIRRLLAGRLTLRRVPEVQFIYDKSVAAQDRVEQILMELHAEEAARQPAADAEPAADAAPPDAPAAAPGDDPPGEP